MNNNTQLIITTTGSLTQIVNPTALNQEPIIVETSILDRITESTGDKEEAAALYAGFQSKYNDYVTTLDMQDDQIGVPKYIPLIIERLIGKLYELGIGQDQIESAISEMKESEIYGIISEAEECAMSEYVDTYASQMARDISEELGYTDDNNRRLEEIFRGR